MTNVYKLTLLMLILLSLGACRSAPTEVVPTIELDYIDMPLGPNEVKHISGTTAIESEGFALEGAGVLSVFWRQDCERFGLGMRNTNETLAEAPGGTLYFEGVLGPSEYVEPAPWAIPYEYIPGEYQFVIDAAGDDCQWEVWALVEYPDQ